MSSFAQIYRKYKIDKLLGLDVHNELIEFLHKNIANTTISNIEYFRFSYDIAETHYSNNDGIITLKYLNHNKWLYLDYHTVYKYLTYHYKLTDEEIFESVSVIMKIFHNKKKINGVYSFNE